MKKRLVTLALALAIVATIQCSIQACGQTQPEKTPDTKYTPEQIEEIKKKNEIARAENALIGQAQTAMNAKDWQAAISPLQQLVALHPTRWEYYSALGDAQFNSAQYEQAIETLQKGIQAAESNTKDDPAKKKAGEARMLTSEGNAYLKLDKNAEAVAAYTKAAGLDPNPYVAYFNLCATLYNTGGNAESALQACDQTIAANPNKADAYFIKGSLLIAGSTIDKNGKVQAPPGAADALNKYLELVPEGPHASDVKQMLDFMRSGVETIYVKGNASLRTSSGVALGNLVNNVEPKYPQLARSARVQGDVVLHALIDEQGNIAKLTVVSGHPTLIQAAMDAVKQWQFKPTLVQGRPVWTETPVRVKFHM